jgi:hypothetical protein
VEPEYVAADTTGRISIAIFDGSDIEEYLAGSTAVNVSIRYRYIIDMTTATP